MLPLLLFTLAASAWANDADHLGSPMTEAAAMEAEGPPPASAPLATTDDATMSVAMESVEGNRQKLTVSDTQALGPNEVYLLQSSTDLQNWKPYRIFVGSKVLTVPQRFEKEFFRVVKLELPKGTASGAISVRNYVPPHWETAPDGTQVFVPESGEYSVRGGWSVDAEALKKFPGLDALFPPQVPNLNLASLEAGIVGSNAGTNIYPGRSSGQWQAPQTFSTRAEAQAYLNGVKVFVTPRFL